jgi:hypothetical protein
MVSELEQMKEDILSWVMTCESHCRKTIKAVVEVIGSNKKYEIMPQLHRKTHYVFHTLYVFLTKL